MSSLIISGPINYRLFKRLVAEFENLDLKPAQPLQLIITSQGGDEGVGRALAGWLRVIAANREVITIAFGDLHSSAVLVFAAGTRRMLSKFAQVFLHESQTEVEGSAKTIRNTAKQLELDEKFWCGIMSELTGTDTKTWLKLHEDETYLPPEEALRLNLATELT